MIKCDNTKCSHNEKRICVVNDELCCYGNIIEDKKLDCSDCKEFKTCPEIGTEKMRFIYFEKVRK